MATMVSFHAHPDDECIVSGGVMRRAADEGHRVVLTVATRGEHGEVADDLLAPDELLWQRRTLETQAAADILGAQRVAFLGYVDSGMMGEPTNDLPGSFWTAPIEEAAQRLAAILLEESADVLTIYDDFGNYGHPDHIQVHRVGVRAAEIAGTPRVYQMTTNRDHLQRQMTLLAEQARAAGVEIPQDNPGEQEMGKPESEITAAVDVTEFLPAKRAAMRAHASQISAESFFLKMPDEVFGVVFGTEWAIRDGQGPGITETDLMADLPV